MKRGRKKLGKAEWGKTLHAVADGGVLYSIENDGSFYATDLSNGAYRRIGKPDYQNTIGILAERGTVITLEKDGSLYRINPRGAFRFHVQAGPALALYHIDSGENAAGAEPAFEGTRQEWGVTFGGGVAWWMSDRFAIEGALTDTITTSPIDRADLPDVPGFEIPKPHNVHTTVGLRWKF